MALSRVSGVGNVREELNLAARVMPGHFRRAFGLAKQISLVVWLLCVGSPTLLFPQEPDREIEALLQIQDEAAFHKQLQTLRKKYRGTAVALYLEALTEPNAVAAVEKYKALATRFPKSKYAPQALMKVAEYYFARGLYISSRRKFQEVVEKYPRSPYVYEARYFALASLCAISRDESCYAELKKYIIENPGSPFLVMAKRDLLALREGKKESPPEPANGRTQTAKGRYTLQVGAFSQVNNALNLKSYCMKLGLPVEVRESRSQGRTMYLVWVGAFETEEAARLFGEKFKREHGKPYRIVTREQAQK